MHKRDVHRLQHEVEELFSELWQVPGFAGLRRGFRPHVDCFRAEEPAAVNVVVDLAGIDPEDVEVAVAERTVVVRGVRRRQTPACRVSYRQMEIEYGQFERRITLADDVDPAGATAEYEHGLLTIVLPLAHKAGSGRVSIAIGARK